MYTKRLYAFLYHDGMRLGIDPKVDYAFKRLFGTPGHEPLLIHLLNAVLHETIPRPIAGVELLNPFDEKDADDDKLAVLDIKARDDEGKLFNVEMQMRAAPHYPARALYYWAGLFRGQIHEGEDYSTLQPAIGIHFVDGVMFPDAPDYHLDFQIRNRERPEVLFSPLLQMHVIQLPLSAPMNNVRDDLQRWCAMLRVGEDLDPRNLPVELTVEPIPRAMEILSMLVQTPREREIYEGRRKQALDRLSDLNWARKEGLQEGRLEGIRETITEVLSERFGPVSAGLQPMIESVKEVEQLRGMMRQAMKAATTDELAQLWTVPAGVSK